MTRHRNTVGFVGLGHMGSAMVEALLGGGYETIVYDLDNDAIQTAETLGARGAADIPTLAGQAEVILTSLPNSAAVRGVYLGENGLLRNAPEGATLVELSTIEPATMVEVGERAGEHGLSVLDVPVSGSPEEARRGALVLTVGGEPRTLDSVRDLLECFGGTIQSASHVGSAKAVKLVNNVMTMGNVLVAAEAFSLGLKAGLEPEMLFELLSRSGGRSHHFLKRFPKALAGEYEPGFTVELGEKDLSLALEMARALGTPMPTTSLSQQMYRISMAEGRASEDIVAILKTVTGWGEVSAEVGTSLYDTDDTDASDRGQG